MKSSCISHPANEPLLVLRQWQIKACDGNVCAAALLSFFEYWHNIKLQTALKAEHANTTAAAHGEMFRHDTSLIQFHTSEELKSKIMIYSEDAIREGIKLLVSKEWISVHKNPDPKYSHDKTKFFYFFPDRVQEWLDDHYVIVNPSPENPVGLPENRVASPENRGSHTKSTSKTSSESSLGERELETQANAIYELYPLKKARPAAIKSITKQLKLFGYERLLERTTRMGLLWNGFSLEFCPHPTTWFNQQRFEDNPDTWKPKERDRLRPTTADHKKGFWG